MFENDNNNVLQVGTVNPQTAEERAKMHPVTKNVYMPRKMFPVEQYAGTVTN